jgi:hypothetical protein
LVVLVWILVVGRPPERIALNDADVVSVAAEVFAVDVMGTDHIPPFTIPLEYHSPILDTLRPIVRGNPPPWDDLATVARLSIRKRDGTKIEIEIPMGGQNRLGYKLNGDWCVRDGRYEPVYDMVLDDGIKMGYADESLLLYDSLRQIHRKMTNGDNDSELVESFENLQRSAGKRPPRPD